MCATGQDHGVRCDFKEDIPGFSCALYNPAVMFPGRWRLQTAESETQDDEARAQRKQAATRQGGEIPRLGYNA